MAGADNDPTIHARIADIFRSHPRSEWQTTFEGSDACAGPVLAMSEVADHPQVQARGCFATLDGVVHPMPAPRFSRTPAPVPDSAATAALPGEWTIQEGSN